MLDQTRLERFKRSKTFRASYTASRVRLAIASQIRALRAQFSETQSDFSKKIGKPQSVVSRLENPDYGQMSVQTLLDIAEKLDVTLVVKFMSYDDFFTLLDDEDVKPDALRVAPFSDTVARHEHISASDNVVAFSPGLQDRISAREDNGEKSKKSHALKLIEEPMRTDERPLYDSLSNDKKQRGAVA